MTMNFPDAVTWIRMTSARFAHFLSKNNLLNDLRNLERLAVITPVMVWIDQNL